jgi:RNA polymerase sigma factor (sigma-70 family)
LIVICPDNTFLKGELMRYILDLIAVKDDNMVIEKILKGDSALFEILIRRYNPVLYKIARSFGFNHQDAQDLMQDTHVSAYTQLAKFEFRAAYKTWVSRIMINKCQYKLKYGYFKNEKPSEQIREMNKQPLLIKTDNNQVEESLANRELALVLEKSIQKIPEIYRMVFVLREIEGFSVVETAELLDITSINVKVRLNRAKALLRREIEQFYSHSELYSFNLIFCDSIVKTVFASVNSLDLRTSPDPI